MKWESNGLNHRLVAEDGEVLERIRWKHGTSEYVVESTGKTYAGIEFAKQAAERKHSYAAALSSTSHGQGSASDGGQR